MAVYTDLPANLWQLSILMLLSEFDLKALFKVSQFFLDLLDPIFLISHHQRHHRLTHSNDFLVVKKPTSVNLFSKQKEKTLIRTADLEVFGTVKGIIGLYTINKINKTIVLYNPFLNTFSPITVPLHHPPRLVAMCYHNGLFQLVVGFQADARVYNPITPNNGWQTMEIPDYLPTAMVTNPYPTAMVKEAPHWSFRNYNKNVVSYISFKFEGQFTLLPVFKKDGAVFLCFKEFYSSFVYNQRNHTMEIYTLKPARWELLYTIGPDGLHGWNGILAQNFVLGKDFLKHQSGSLILYNEDTKITRSVRGAPGQIYRVFNYEPSVLTFRPDQKASWKDREKYSEPTRLLSALGM